MLGCGADGNLDEAGFSRPMPWIGLYIAGASLACGLAMAADVITAFRYRTCWFPCSYFSLNAMSLTVISVAIKLSVDLNTAMPRQQDQLSKLTSSALICTVLANSMPSIGDMENAELMSNIAALAILVVTAIVNISIQLSTGVIFSFVREHVFLIILMLMLLVMVSFSAIAVPTTKAYLEMKYCDAMTIKEKDRKPDTVIKRLKEDLIKSWMMAFTGNPQFVVSRSATCTSAGALCLLSAAVVAEAMVRSFGLAGSGKLMFCTGESDYKWSTIVILISQTLAVAIGTVGPGLRWFRAIKFKCPNNMNKGYMEDFKLEKYWTKMLVEMKESPFLVQFRSRYCRKIAHGLKNKVLELCIGLQSGIVFASKAIRLVSVMFAYLIFVIVQFIIQLIWRFMSKNITANEDPQLGLDRGSKLDLRHYVLYLEGEEELVHLLVRKKYNLTPHFINMGKNNEPKYLVRFLKEYHSHGFGGVLKFDRNRVSPLAHEGEEPPSCWALPIATLVCIGAALPNIESTEINQLLHSVNEGLMYVELIEEASCQKGPVTNARKAANIVWLGVDLYHRWLDVDLRKLSNAHGNSPKEILEALSEAAKNMLVDFKEKPSNECFTGTPSSWPVKIIAAHSMYQISQTMLLDYKQSCNETLSRKMFDDLLVTVSDILGACLTSLDRVISMEYCRSTIEQRKESVARAGVLLGKTKKVIQILSKRHTPCFGIDEVASIDEWRAAASNHLRDRNDSAFTAFEGESEKGHTGNSTELRLSIEFS